MRVAFESFVFDTDQRQLVNGGEPVHLSPKAFLLLELLINRAPAAVSRETIYDALWGSTFVVDANVPNLISEIRTALGDSPRDPRFIRTVHRHGYSFVGAARETAVTASRFVVEWASRSFPLHAGENILGRDASCDVHIDSAGVSRRHAAIVVSGESVTLHDRGSKNGTFLGRRHLTDPLPLESGDVIRLGSVRVVFRASPRSDSTLTEFGSAADVSRPDIEPVRRRRRSGET